jgi:hypothetical protein
VVEAADDEAQGDALAEHERDELGHRGATHGLLGRAQRWGKQRRNGDREHLAAAQREDG